jgi:hypothetical protein
MKFGVEFRAGANDEIRDRGSAGVFGISPLITSLPGVSGTGNALASFLLGEVNAASILVSDKIRTRASYWAFFAQDDWKIGRRLTFNIGLRWDLFSPREEHNTNMSYDPVTGAKRFLSDDSSRISDKPPEMVPSALQAVGSLGMLSRGSNTNAFEGDNKAFLELNMLYGDPRIGRSRTPYDDFTVLLRFGGGGGLSEAKVRGRLIGQPFHNNRIQFNVTQAYDFAKNNAFQFGAQAFNGNVAATFGSLSDGLSFWMNGWGGLTALGAVDSIPLEGVVACEAAPPDGEGAGQGVSEGPRCYDYGPGTDFGARAILTHSGRPIIDFLYETHHLYSLDGVRANHFLQQLRLDLLVPLKGPLGVGFAGEYFDRRTYFSQTDNPTQKFHFPQVRLFMTWRFS